MPFVCNLFQRISTGFNKSMKKKSQLKGFLPSLSEGRFEQKPGRLKSD